MPHTNLASVRAHPHSTFSFNYLHIMHREHYNNDRIRKQVTLWWGIVFSISDSGTSVPMTPSKFPDVVWNRIVQHQLQKNTVCWPNLRGTMDQTEIRLRSDWDQAELNQAEIRLKSDWDQTEIRLRSDWDQTEIRLRSDWDQTEIKLRSAWDQTEIRLRSDWTQTEIRLRSDWDQTEIRLKSD